MGNTVTFFEKTMVVCCVVMVGHLTVSLDSAKKFCGQLAQFWQADDREMEGERDQPFPSILSPSVGYFMGIQ
jgi:hypothetical protein